jgi:16S rRNA G527 N7-methylase RsmG
MTETPPCVATTIAWLGIDWTDRQTAQLWRYARWLGDEGVRIGGIGPGEIERIWSRHICDSLVFGRGLETGDEVLDVGSGVGLPGVPLTVAFPGARITLLDRSGRRIDALHRVTRLMKIEPTIVEQDVTQWSKPVDRLVFRASLPIPDAMRIAGRLLTVAGEAWFGLGRGEHPEAVAAWQRRPHRVEGLSAAEVRVPPGILDSPVWLLRIVRT